MLVDPSHLNYVLAGAGATLAIMLFLGARVWGFVYLALIPFVNWSFTWAPNIPVPFIEDVLFNPVTIVTGLVLVVRDFAQREMGHPVLGAMAIALIWSIYYAGPELALASGAAFAIAEFVDYLLFTFTRLRLSSRVMLSSLFAAPIDSAVFLYGANFIRDGMLSVANWTMSVAGKLFGALAVAIFLRSQGE